MTAYYNDNNDSCCCLYDADDYPPTLHTAMIRRAVTDWTCGECRESIPRGAQYEHVKGLWDGMWIEHRTCLPCVGIRNTFFTCGWVYGRLVEDFAECNGWDYREVPAEDGE